MYNGVIDTDDEGRRRVVRRDVAARGGRVIIFWVLVASSMVVRDTMT